MKKAVSATPLFTAVALVAILAGCSADKLTEPQLSTTNGSNAVSLSKEGACGTTTWGLTAGQHIDVGSVTVENDANNVYVTYTLDYPGACFGTLHVWVGDNLANMPKTGKGSPIPGQFPYHHDASGQTSHTFTIPFSDLGITDLDAVCGNMLFVVTHAEVDMDCNPETDNGETAFGGDTRGNGPRWWFYGEYAICCPEEPPPPPDCQTETAWGGSSAGGGAAWWYYFDTQGDATQPIYAGQNLTDGTVTWDGTNLTIDLGSWSLQNVSESVKVQGYDVIPDSRPNAGQFTTYKGSDLVVPGDGSRYYAIHLDVELCE